MMPHTVIDRMNWYLLCYVLIYVTSVYAGSALMRTWCPGDSGPSAFRLPNTESGVAVRACGVNPRGAGPSLVTSA